MTDGMPSEHTLAAWAELSARSRPRPIVRATPARIGSRRSSAPVSTFGPIVAITIGVIVALGYLALPARPDPTQPTPPAGGTTGVPSMPSAAASSGPPASPSRTVTPVPTLAYDDRGVPVVIDGETVFQGSGIIARLVHDGGASFLVTGELRSGQFGCDDGSRCPAGPIWILEEPGLPPGARKITHNLLVEGGLWAPAPPRDLATWPGGVSVLRVHAYRGACPWETEYCAGQLVVEAVIPPPADATGTPVPSTSIPTTIDGEPVVTGAAIDAKVADQPGVGFLVAGRLGSRFVDCGPERRCPPGPITTLQEPDVPGGARGTSHSVYNDRFLWTPDVPEDLWDASGLVVLRVRGHDQPCPWEPAYCDGALLVEDVIPPPPPARPGYDADGIPLDVDGQPVLRGDAIRRRVASGDRTPFVAAGWVVPYSTHCPGGRYDCPWTQLADESRTWLDEALPVIALLPHQAPDWPTWDPGEYSVLVVQPGCAMPEALTEGICLLVVRFVPDPDALPTPPAPTHPPSYDTDGVPIMVGGEPVFDGVEIDEVLGLIGATEPFLVTGLLKEATYSCPECPVDPVMVLDAPRPDRGAGEPRYLLLDTTGPWSSSDDRRWPLDLFVLRVSALDRPCPWPGMCSRALLVLEMIPPP